MPRQSVCPLFVVLCCLLFSTHDKLCQFRISLLHKNIRVGIWYTYNELSNLIESEVVSNHVKYCNNFNIEVKDFVLPFIHI